MSALSYSARKARENALKQAIADILSLAELADDGEVIA